MSKFGEYEGYTGEECEQCGRVRVEHFSRGFDICEKCGWCKQLQYCVPDYEFYDDEYGEEVNTDGIVETDQGNL